MFVVDIKYLRYIDTYDVRPLTGEEVFILKLGPTNIKAKIMRLTSAYRRRTCDILHSATENMKSHKVLDFALGTQPFEVLH